MQLTILPSSQLSNSQLAEIVELCTAAFDEDYQPYLDNFGPADHVLCHDGGRLVSHALWVERWLQPGELLPLRTAYIEGVCTDMDHRGRGYASAVMRCLAAAIERDFEFAALGTRSHSFYAQHGWERWRGPTFVRTGDGIEAYPSEFVMILRLPRTPLLDPAWSLSCEWRPGDIW
jgi:aminoglycoside 2'-N-acetyltransferase I